MFSSLLRLTVQCGNQAGTAYPIFLNGVNIVNMTIAAGFIPKQFWIQPVSGIMTFYTVQFRYVIIDFSKFAAVRNISLKVLTLRELRHD
jgi:hypothetical protein